MQINLPFNMLTIAVTYKFLQTMELAYYYYNYYYYDYLDPYFKQ